MMKELQITIAGPVGSGKSTMVLLLEQILIEKGFNVELQLEPEVFEHGSEERFRRTMAENFSEREKRLLKNTKITLTQMQTNRGTWKEN
jgi:nucleoside-triphosphatase THEP1